MDSVRQAINQMLKTDDSQFPIMALTEIQKARAFHESFPQYTQTPLARLDYMAAYLGVSQVFMKDESYRFGSNTFKVLGGSFAMARYIAKETGEDMSELPYAVLTSDKLREGFGQATFFIVTDDNHGWGVTWAASRLGQKAVVHMLRGTTRACPGGTEREGASVGITGMNYDDRVRLAVKEVAEAEHGVVIQNTAQDGYEEIPIRVMQGYGTMAAEASEQLEAVSYECPTHVLVQIGVSSLADAVVGYLTNPHPDNPPTFVVAEANITTCLYKGAAAGDGKPRIVGDNMQTTMAGLACGEPNTVSWDILKNHVKMFIFASNWVVAKGMRVLGTPVKNDLQVTSGKSGVAPFGAPAAMIAMEEYKELRNDIDLDKNSKVLLLSAKGDTGPERYRNTTREGEER